MTSYKRYLLLCALLLVAALPIASLRDFTPDNELRYLSIADEALADGHLFAFFNQGEAYADKPPLYLWIVMLGKLLFGQHVMLFLALFSLLPALLITCLMDRWTASYTTLSDTTRGSGMLMLLSAGLFLGLSVTLRMDLLMCLFITLALYTFYKIYSGRASRGDVWLFPIYLFLGVFTKGPIGILVPLCATLVFLLVEGKLSTVGRYWGWRTWGTLAGLCILWFGCVYAEGGTSYLNNLLFHQTVNRAVNAFHHKAPFYFYLTSFWYSLAPWSLLIVWLLVRNYRQRTSTSSLERFYLVVALTTLVMLSCISSKIAIYLAPAFPFFVYSAVILLEKESWNRVTALTLAVPATIFSLAIVALFVADKWQLAPVYTSYYPATLALSLSGVTVLYTLYERHDLHRSIAGLAGGLLLTLCLAGFALPALNSSIGFREVCSCAQEMSGGDETVDYLTLGVRRPESMDVFLQKDIEEIEDVETLVNNDYTGKILITTAKQVGRSEELRHCIEHKAQHEVGPYLVVKL